KFADATCEYPSQCTRCGKTDGNALGHLYDNDTCIRCGQIDPDTLPVNLETLHIIDSSDFSLENLVTDTYGNTHEVAFRYWAYDAYSTHNLNKEFSTFSGSIAVSHEGKGGTVRIYVDDKLAYTSELVSRESYKVDFSINVKNAQKIKITASKNGYYSMDSIIIVDAKLYK
ncbi:MAG: NPCBM/NEW2 domain-containing protein, partial [Clostridia bacterium]|nr:NPCBM/NEW2 domain-containing protein [Clostridia bacterium]